MFINIPGAHDDDGQSPLDKAMEGVELDDERCVEIAVYLMYSGYGGDKERVEVLCAACFWGMLDIVKEMVEQLKIDPSKCVQ